jgi:hypothetical protein
MRRNSRPGRCTRAERDARVAELQAMIAAGVAPHAAARACAKRWGLEGRRSRSRYLEAALASWWREAQIGRRASLAVALGRRENVFRLALASDDLAAANRALDAIELLMGIPEPDAKQQVEPLIGSLMAAIVEASPDRDVAARILDRVKAVMDEPDGGAGRNGHLNGRAFPS